MRACLLLFTVAAFVMLGACDSGDPGDEPVPGDVAGEYLFTEFTFVPEGSAVAPIVVLDTLDQSGTSLLLSTGGDYILSYQFIGGQAFFLDGAFNVSEFAVELSGDPDDREDYQALLLSEDFTMRRDPADPGVLSAEIATTIDPSAFSDRYRGVPSLSGTLNLRLELQ